MNEEQKGFKVQDRRLFTSEGELRIQREDDSGAPSPIAQPIETAQPTRPRPSSPGLGEGVPGEQVSFTSFVMSLATQAGALLEDGQELGGARHIISILEMLERKTKGRLEQDEERILEGLLYQLRMAYVERARTAPA
jgi:hypothetical protein